jgi:hypothetical protein
MPKIFTPTPDMVRAAESVFLAKAHLDLIAPIVGAYQREALQHINAAAAPRWKDAAPAGPIQDPALAFLLGDDDFKTYIDRTRRARQAAGLVVDDEEQCPLLVAQALLVQAERELLQAIEPVSGIPASRVDTFTLADRTQFIDLALKLLAPFVREASELLGGIVGATPPARGRETSQALDSPTDAGAAGVAVRGAAGAIPSPAEQRLQ